MQNLISSAQSAVSSRYRNYVLGVCCAVYALNFLDRQILNMLVDPIKAEFGASDAAMGLLTGFGFSISYMLFSLPVARWSDVGNRRVIATAAVTIWSVMTAVAGFTTQFWQLFLARVGVGAGESGCTPVLQSMLADYFPRAIRAKVLSIFQFSLYVGVVLGYLIGGWVTATYGWRAAFLVAGAPGIAVALLFYLTVREPSRGVAEIPKEAGKASTTLQCLRFFRTQPSLLWILAGFSITAFSNFSFGVWTPSFLRRVHHLSNGEIGVYLGLINGIAGGGGTLVGGLVVHRAQALSEKWAMVWPAIVTLASVPFFAAYLLTPQVHLALLFYFFAVFTISFHLGPVFSSIVSLSKAGMRALAVAAANLLTSLIGSGVGPAVIGKLNDILTAGFGNYAVRWSLLVAAIAPLFGAFCFWAASRTLSRDFGRAEPIDSLARA